MGLVAANWGGGEKKTIQAQIKGNPRKLYDPAWRWSRGVRRVCTSGTLNDEDDNLVKT